MVRVRVEVTTEGAKESRAWWAEVTPQVVGEGSGRRVGVKGDPRWLPRPQREASAGPYVAWVDRDPGTYIRAGGDAIGGYRHARVASPVLVVEDGAQWEGHDRDGTRYVTVRVYGARPASVEEVEAMAQGSRPQAHVGIRPELDLAQLVTLLRQAENLLEAGDVAEALHRVHLARQAVDNLLAETGA